MKRYAICLLGVLALVGSEIALVIPKAEALDKLNIGVGADPTWTTFLIAQEKGFYEKHGIDAKLKTFASGGPALDALLAGELDMTAPSELPAISARVRGKLTIMPGINYYAPNYMGVLSRKNITKPEDLIGKTVAISAGTASEYYFYLYSKKYKLPKDKIAVKNVMGPEMIPSLDRGHVDACFTWEPLLSRGVDIVKDSYVFARGGDKGPGGEAIYPFTNVLNLSTNLAKNRELSGRLLLALIDAENFAKQYPDQAALIASKAFKLPEDMAKKSLSVIDFRIEMSDKILETLKMTSAWLIEVGKIKEEPDWNNFVDWELLKSVAPERVVRQKN